MSPKKTACSSRAKTCYIIADVDPHDYQKMNLGGSSSTRAEAEAKLREWKKKNPRAMWDTTKVMTLAQFEKLPYADQDENIF